MSTIRNLYEYAKENNIIFGILLNDMISFLAYIISLGVSFIVPGDIHMAFGAIVGVYFALKYLKKEQSPILFGLTVSILGNLLAALSISIFLWVRFGIIDIGTLGIFLIPALTLGIVIGGLMGVYFYSKIKKPKESLIRDDFFDSLKSE